MATIVGNFEGDLTGKAKASGQVIVYNTFDPDTIIWGDVTGVIRNQARGGDDKISVSEWAEGGVFGDAAEILDTARGGSDTITLSDEASNTAYGDAYYIGGSGVGGNDTLAVKVTATSGPVGTVNTFVGDAFYLHEKALGGNDTIQHLGFGETNTYGDALEMGDSTKGGNDKFYLTTYGENWVWGDAGQMTGSAKGGADLISFQGGSNDETYGWINRTNAFGDGGSMNGYTVGGNDTIEGSGGDRTTIVARGDAGSMSGNAKGGQDTINLTGGSNSAMGDASTMTDNAIGGADKLFGNSTVANNLIGDAETMDGRSKGGKDVLTLGSGSGVLSSVAYGDAMFMRGAAAGSDDRIIGGTNDDHMWGDGQLFDKAKGGKDTFVFLANSGNDYIADFKQGMDKIELRGTKAHSFADLKIEKTTLEFGDKVSIVHLDAVNDITVVTSATLKASDFLIFV